MHLLFLLIACRGCPSQQQCGWCEASVCKLKFARGKRKLKQKETEAWEARKQALLDATAEKRREARSVVKELEEIVVRLGGEFTIG